MPDREVKTICDLIYYQYAKIIVRWPALRSFSGGGASGVSDGKEANLFSISALRLPNKI